MDYFKLLRFIQIGDKSFFDISFLKQKEYLDSLPLPKDDIDRSYYQFLCQTLFQARWKVIALNIVASVIFPFIFVLLTIRRIGVKNENIIDAYGEFYSLEEIIPQELHQRFIIENRKWKEEKSISLRDWRPIFLIIVRHPLSPFFCLKVMIKLSVYSHAIKQHSPRAIIIHNEPSFTCSALRYYCSLRNVLLINVMHGEKIYNIRDSFVHFDEYFVWSDYYVNLLKSLGAEDSQFKIAVPASIKIEVSKYQSTECYADYKYYLAFFNEEEIQSVVNSMQFVKRNGETVRYRPHPRYSDINLLRKYVQEEEIEYPKDVNILSSISNLKYAIGSYTTVLNQAYFSGKGVICDDVTFKKQYDKLKELKYIMASISLPKLSDFQY